MEDPLNGSKWMVCKWKTLLKWMMWGYPYDLGNHMKPSRGTSQGILRKVLEIEAHHPQCRLVGNIQVCVQPLDSWSGKWTLNIWILGKPGHRVLSCQMFRPVWYLAKTLVRHIVTIPLAWKTAYKREIKPFVFGYIGIAEYHEMSWNVKRTHPVILFEMRHERMSCVLFVKN